MGGLKRALFFLSILSLSFPPAWAGEKEYSMLRKKMVEEQLLKRKIADPRVLEAMSRVKRHLFVLPGDEGAAYNDNPLPIGHRQTISQPYIVALMTELLHLKGDENILEIGTGSGYQAAILGELVRRVFTIEIVEPLALNAKNLLKDLGYANISVRHGDGYRGWKEEAPFDGILITAAPRTIPEPLLNQLKIGGRMVLPVGGFYQELVVITRRKKGYEREVIIPVRFVPMTGEIEKGK